MAMSVPELVEPVPTEQDTFVTRHHPVRMGNAADIAYGGCAMAFAVTTSAASVNTEHYRIYSMLGHFLSGAKADRPLHATVSKIRDTHGFATRAVLVSQVLDDGSSRSVLSAEVDYHRIESGTLLNYSVPPPALANPLAESLTQEESFEHMVKLPGSSEAHVQFMQIAFEPAFRFFDYRASSNSVASQNMYGFLKKAPTSQDTLPLTGRGSFDWWRSKTPLRTHADNACTLVFQLDSAVAFIPLTHSHMFLQDAAACSSLDFAFRVFENELDLNQWHLREIKTTVGASGRTFSAARVFDQAGKLVAEMSQQCILRPHKKNLNRM